MFLEHLLIKLLLSCSNDTKDAFELCKQKYELKKRRETGFTKVHEICLAAFCRLALQSLGALQHLHILGCYIWQKHNTPFNNQMFTSQWCSGKTAMN